MALLALVIGAQPGRAQQVSTALATKAPEATTLAATAQANGHVHVIVLLATPSQSPQGRPDAAALAAFTARVAATQNTVLTNHFGSATNPRPGRGFERHHHRFEVTPGFAIDVDASELESLAADPLVKSIHIDRARPPTLLQSLPLIGQPAAYSNGATGAGWAVAVLDTGVQSNHEFLSGKVVAEACFSNAGGAGGGVTLCPNGQTSQTGTGAANSTTANCINSGSNLCWHGTHVAGIAAGLNTSQSTGEPTNGAAHDGKIFAAQIFTRFNTSGSCNGGTPPCLLAYTSDEISALDYVYQHLTPVTGVNVASVNMSLGGGTLTSTACDTDPDKPAIDNLRAAGVLSAIAAGNDGSFTQISHPGCISSAVAVASSTKTDVVSSFSNMATIVAVLAPGGLGGSGDTCQLGGNNPDILSSYAGSSSGTTNLYACAAGTSMATPHVAGAIAALRTACPNSTPDALLSALESTGVSITDTRTGAPGTITKPRIRLDSALAALNCGGGTLVVSPTSDINAAGPQGGPFSPASSTYTLSTTAGLRNYSISGVPSWLTASSTSGTATTSGTAVSFTVNASANSLAIGTYTAKITFTDTTGNTTVLAINAVLVVDDVSVLQVSPSTNMASVGNPGGPFSPSSFQYQLSTNNGSANYSIGGLPSWLSVSSSSGTATTTPATITFTVNSNANSLPIGAYNATISFTNTTNGNGNQTRNAALTVNSGGTAAPATRTWVSGGGSDGNDCTLTAPCQTFAGALAKTVAGGEIDCLDAGAFGAVTITKAVTIDCGGGEGGQVGSILASGTDAVTLNAGAADRIILRNLDLNGINQSGAGGLAGINVAQAGALTLKNVKVMNFNNACINMAVSGHTNLFLFKSILQACTGGGVVSSATSGINRLNISASQIAQSGVGVTAGANTDALIHDSTVSNNGGGGVLANAAAALVTIDQSTVSNNQAFGVHASNGAVTSLSNSSVAFNNGTGLMADGGGQILTWQNVRVAGNSPDGARTGTVAPQ